MTDQVPFVEVTATPTFGFALIVGAVEFVKLPSEVWNGAEATEELLL